MACHDGLVAFVGNGERLGGAKVFCQIARRPISDLITTSVSCASIPSQPPPEKSCLHWFWNLYVGTRRFTLISLPKDVLSTLWRRALILAFAPPT